MIRIAAAIALAGLLAPTVGGQVRSPQNEALRHIVAIRSSLSGGEAEVGAGILVGRRDGQLVVLTARHVVFDSGGDPAEQIRVRFERQDEWVTAGEILAHEEASDLAAFSIREDKSNLAVDSLFSGLRVAPVTMSAGGPGRVLGVADTLTGKVASVEVTLGKANGDRVGFSGPDIRPGHSGGGLFTRDWYLVGLVHSRGGGDDDHEASSFKRMAAFSEKHELPLELNTMPGLSPFVGAQDGGRSAVLFLWRKVGPKKIQREWVRLQLDRREDTRFSGMAFCRRKSDRFTLTAKRAGCHAVVPAAITDIRGLHQLDFRLEPEDVLPGFAVFRIDDDEFGGDLLVPRGEARLVLEDILGKQGTGPFMKHSGMTRTLDGLHTRADRPPLAPIYLQVYKKNWEQQAIPVSVHASMRAAGIRLVGRVSFNRSFYAVAERRQSKLLSSRLVVLGEDRITKLREESVPSPDKPLDFDFTIADPGAEIFLAAQGPLGGSPTRVVIEGLRILPQ